MLCSLASRSSTSSNWLLRLHASHGLSFPPHLDLDVFLANPNPRNPDPANPGNPSAAPLPSNPMTAVLADLFVMPGAAAAGGGGGGGKSSRKQPVPRICPAAASPSAGSPAAAAAAAVAASGGDNSVAEAARKAKGKGRKRRRAATAAAESTGERCSRTEVTVIDTSTPGWKSAKVVFRKGAAWKVRDKKHWTVAKKKKRRLGLVGKLSGEKGREKEEMAVGSKDTKEHLVNSEEGNMHPDNGGILKELDEHIQLPLRRPRCSGSVREIKSTSILRLQGMTKGKKNGLACSKGNPKGR